MFVNLFNDKGHKRHDAGFFDGIGQSSLMLGASSMTFWRINLPLRIHKTAQKISVFVIDLVYLAFAKEARFLFDLLVVVIVVIIHNFVDRESWIVK